MLDATKDCQLLNLIHGAYIVNFNPHEARIRKHVACRKQASNDQKFGFLGNGSSRLSGRSARNRWWILHVHAPPSGSMWSNGVWIDRDVRIVGGAAVRMRSHQDSRRQAFTACLRFAAREFIASLPLRFTTYYFTPLFVCLYV